MSRVTQHDNIYLVGLLKKQIFGRKLPTTKQVLSVLFYQHNVLKQTIRKSATVAIEQAEKFWSAAKIPALRKHIAIAKLEKIFGLWGKVNKNRCTINRAQKARERDFTIKLNSLFDIADKNALQKLTKKDEQDFLLDQRTNRKLELSAYVDVSEKCSETENFSEDSDILLTEATHDVYATDMPEEDIIDVVSILPCASQASCGVSFPRGSPQLSLEVDVSLQTRVNYGDSTAEPQVHCRSFGGNISEMKSVSFSSVSSQELSTSSRYSADSESSLSSSDELSDAASTRRKKRSSSNFSDEFIVKKPKINLVTPSVTAALDRTNTSSRSATHIIASVATVLGHDINDLNCSHSTIHRHREKCRTKIATGIKENFQNVQSLVVHWDGKLLPGITGKDTQERLPIIVSGVDTEQLLGIPALPSGTGANQANAIIKALDDWNVTNQVQAMCFDTTSSNTGRINGACVIIEQTLKRNLLYLPCRHHIFELILRSVVEIYWPTTTGPNVPIFKRFQQVWPQIDQTRYRVGVDDKIIANTLQQPKNEIVNFILSQLQTTQPRDDYREFLELSCVFLGETPPRGVHFKVPGAMHHARWLSKAIYCLKIFMFSNQFKLTANETNGLRHICTFIVGIYLKAWFSAPKAISAPPHDLKLFQSLIGYKHVNAKVSQAARTKLAAHLWYLSEELVALALFDDNVSVETKIRMVERIRYQKSVTKPPKRVHFDGRDLDAWLAKDIDEFATQNSIDLLRKFSVNCDFLQLHPERWSRDPGFQSAFNVFKNLKVVNDTAERGVALMEKYNNCLTTNEEQKQYLLQVVQQHRKTHPNCHKKSFRMNQGN